MNIDFLSRSTDLTVDLKENGSLSIKSAVEGGRFEVRAVLRHIKFGTSVISTNFYTAGAIERTGGDKIKSVKGKAWSQASLLNFKPLKEFSADYEIADSVFIIKRLSWADINCLGMIESESSRLKDILFKPRFDLSLDVKGMDLKEFAGLLGINPQDIALSGNVTGNIKITGPKDSLKIEALISASDGQISELKFKSAKVSLEGLWPVLRFEDSNINDASGIVYKLTGQFNLKELSNFNSSEHKVLINSSNNAFRFQDWVIKRQVDRSGQEMVEAEYPIKHNESLKMRIKNQEEILGWEKTIKF